MNPVNIDKAIQYVKDNSKTSFDASIELHINLDLDSNQSVRFSANLPHGTGKTKRVAVMASKKIENADIQLDEQDLVKIEKGDLKPKIDFDVFVAEPQYMAKIAKVARVLGPAGMMPNPKTGTVSDDVTKVVNEVKKGKVEVRTEPNAPIVHTVIGKRSFDNKKLVENYEEIMSLLRQNRPAKAKPEWIKTCFVNATMGPSAQVLLEGL
ncbi:MAG: 50S ribosomal protein L1 [Patescibacteria group bacterium]|jgi:large subunit ribosomal protein L1